MRILKELHSQTELKTLFNYNEHTGVLIWKIKTSKKINIGDIAGNKISKDGYIKLGMDGKLYQTHRLIWKYYHGTDPVNFIDHINGDRSDNRISNLREATHTENLRNRKKNFTNTSGFKGVSYQPKSSKWMARASTIYLGCFDTAEEASEVYIKFTKEQFKEFYKDIS